MPTPIASQLDQARAAKKVLLKELCRLAHLTCGADSLCRKLKGKQPLTTDEAQSIAQALDHAIVWAPERARRSARSRAA